MHLYLQLTRLLADTLIWFYCNKLVLRYVRLRVSDQGQVSIPAPRIATMFMKTAIVPIIKNKTRDTSDKNNYRPIALVTTASNFLIMSLNYFRRLFSYT